MAESKTLKREVLRELSGRVQLGVTMREQDQEYWQNNILNQSLQRLSTAGMDKDVCRNVLIPPFAFLLSKQESLLHEIDTDNEAGVRECERLTNETLEGSYNIYS